ncbi:MAG: heat-inducible transcriptional repressor HrcA [Eggerthellaceae bacterium]
MLSDRRQKVLAALIEEYVARALPVGSRTIAERYKLGVSSATVRNELSVLEDDGYITQPYTSSGRIPTDYGYRSFVDDLLDSGLAPQDEAYDAILKELEENADEIETLLDKTSSALTRFTDCLSIVIAPSVLKLQIKQLSLVSLSPHRALVVLITEDGQVFNRQMEFADEVSTEELSRVQTFLNEVFSGKSLHDLENGLGRSMDKAMHDPLMRLVLDKVLSCIQESEAGRAHRLGMSTLLKKPEFKQSQSLLPIIKVLEDDTILLQILDDAVENEDEDKPMVRIGSENASEELSGVSVIASKYGDGDNEGVVAVVGPTRMDYSKVINAVHLASRALDDMK